jgi:hypothetical protein
LIAIKTDVVECLRTNIAVVGRNWPQVAQHYRSRNSKAVKAHFRPKVVRRETGKRTFQRLNSLALRGFMHKVRWNDGWSIGSVEKSGGVD